MFSRPIFTWGNIRLLRYRDHTRSAQHQANTYPHTCELSDQTVTLFNPSITNKGCTELRATHALTLVSRRKSHGCCRCAPLPPLHHELWPKTTSGMVLLSPQPHHNAGCVVSVVSILHNSMRNHAQNPAVTAPCCCCPLLLLPPAVTAPCCYCTLLFAAQCKLTTRFVQYARHAALRGAVAAPPPQPPPVAVSE